MESSSKANQTETKDKPIHEIRLGRIKAAIWPNQTENGVRHNTIISRLYKDELGWNSTHSFYRDDLLLMGKVADLAHTWICEREKESVENA